uniref:Endo/exonuclease/phosphatase domain-containing protein n=2 Tax=Bursaphelenchus xylophilus TaxID=6326 RepID=A0A1I7RSY1_BURXY
MTFNVWDSGTNVENGDDKIIQQIRDVKVDVYNLQEIQNKTFIKIMEAFPHFDGRQFHVDTCHVATFTKHKIILEHEPIRRLNVRIRTHIGNEFEIVNMHLQFRDYGPDILEANPNLTTEELLRLSSQAHPTRQEEIVRLLNVDWFKRAQKLSWIVPIIITGDFNTPSDLDWQEDTKSRHHGLVVPWPATKALEDAGLVDSYRKIHPSPVSDPGITWSPITNNIPLDRIDFVFYQSLRLKVKKSFTYTGKGVLTPIPNQKQNNWPSDHRALITDFYLL